MEKYRLSLFTVIVCAFNEEKYIEKCIKSLINQDFPKNKYEIIIMDNESTDSTPEIAKRLILQYKQEIDIKYFRIKHVGLSSSRNTGISIAQGNIIGFVDADAYIDEGWIKNIMLAFDTSNQISIVAGRVCNLNNDSFFSRFIYHAHYSAGVKARSNINVGGLTGANMAFRKKVFDITGGFYNAFTSYGDETSVAIKYLKKNPDSVLSYADKAIVFNEHPESLILWLKNRFFQGRMLFLINLHIEKSNIFELFLKVLVKFLGILSLATLLLIPFFKISNAIIILAIFFIFLVIVRRYKYLFSAYNDVSSNMNFFLGLPAVFICIFGSIMSDIGFFREAVISLTGRKIDMSNSVSSVIDSK